MNKIFSHKVALQIISVVLLILLGNSYIQNRNLNEYVYERVDRDLDRAISELDHMNEGIFGLYMEGNLEKDYRINMEYISSLGRFDREIEKIFNIPRATFDWYDLGFIKWTINDMKEKGHLSKEDEEYLKSIHNYNKKLILSYHEILKENKIDENALHGDHKKIKKVYKEFMAEANKIAIEEEYRRISRYKVEVEERETVENKDKEKIEANINLKEAEELAVEVLEKLFHEKALLIKDKGPEEDEYEFYNKWEDGKDKNLYHISIDREDGSFSMYRRSQLVTSTFSEEDLDKKAREIKDIFVSKDYICYEREKRFHQGKLEEISYKFIKKIDNVYDESHRIEIEMNVYGNLSNLRISDPLNNKNIVIGEPELTKEDIISKLSRGKVDHVLLVKDPEGQLQYRIFVDFNEEIYTYTFDANTGEKRDFGKGDKMYFKRVDNM